MKEKDKLQKTFYQDDDIKIHSSVLRESDDKLAATKSMPIIIMVLVAIATLIGGVYFSTNFNGFSNTQFSNEGGNSSNSSANKDEVETDPLWLDEWVKKGRKEFASCIGCHGANGKGTTCPPLDNSEWVTGSPEVITKILLKGLTGEIKVKGKTYNDSQSKMDGMENTMSSEQLAQVMTYVRRSFGNQASPITTEMVDHVKEQVASKTDKYKPEELEKDLANDDLNKMLPENWQTIKLSEFNK